ncbi:MAG: DNA repair protein RecO [Bacteroidetes bacterium]|nr:DNA repair protein RecO [Bacteroidota bacterium]
MSEIIKTKAVVIKKLDYGDTSKIATFYTEDYGKITGIIKGARTAKSKMGPVVDILNTLQIVYYKKENREVQLISKAELINHHSKIKEDLDKLKFASAVAELLLHLNLEDEAHPKLFKGTVKILELMNESKEVPEYYFIKYLIFFLKELGYEIQLENCSCCGNNTEPGEGYFFNFNSGILCMNCKNDQLISFEFSPELFNLLMCLSRRNNECKYSVKDLNRLIYFFEKYISYHIPEFKGLKSLHVY